MTPSQTSSPRPTFGERHASRIRQWRLYAHVFAASFSSMLGLALVLLLLERGLRRTVLQTIP